jgi:hypothetical protein
MVRIYIMCVDETTSLISFLVGEISGILLLGMGEEKQLLGFFVMFYTMVQYHEYNMYRRRNYHINTNLLLLNLSMQGLVFFLLVNRLCDLNSLYIYISIFIIVLVVLMMCEDDVSNEMDSGPSTCLTWNFITPRISVLLTIMYLVIFYWIFTQTKSSLFTNAGYLFITIAMVSYIFHPNGPSAWCMSSALASPVFLLL